MHNEDVNWTSWSLMSLIMWGKKENTSKSMKKFLEKVLQNN